MPTLIEALPDRVFDDMKSKTFKATRYKSDNGFEIPGLVVLTIALAVAGFALGWLAHFVSQWFYLIILFPGGMGLLLGAVGSRICHSQKIRNPFLGAIVGLMAGTFAMGMMHYLDYRNAASEFSTLQTELQPLIDATPEDRETMIAAQNLNAEERESVNFVFNFAKEPTFAGYMKALATKGVSISKAGRSSSSGINLGYVGSFIYWILEVMIVAGVCAWILWEDCKVPFCKGCSSWKHVYSTTKLPLLDGNKEELKSAVELGNLGKVVQWMDSAIPAALQKKDGDISQWNGHVSFQYAGCEKCQTSSTVDFKVQKAKISRKGELKMVDVVHVTYPADSRPLFTALFAAADKTAT